MEICPDISEVLRYLGAGAANEDLRRQAEDFSARTAPLLQPKWVWRVFPIEHINCGYSAAGLRLEGSTAQTMLEGCHHAALLCCTLGAQFETMLRAAQARDMAAAVLLDAFGSAQVEAGCDVAQAEIQARFPGEYTTDRFSPGYGDLSLTLQPTICQLLDTQRRLGVVSTPSLLLNPTKSVTAILGLSRSPQMARVRGCGHCALFGSCTLRKGGTSCVL